jgi:hypothetical protein
MIAAHDEPDGMSRFRSIMVTDSRGTAAVVIAAPDGSWIRIARSVDLRLAECGTRLSYARQVPSGGSATRSEDHSDQRGT